MIHSKSHFTSFCLVSCGYNQSTDAHDAAWGVIVQGLGGSCDVSLSVSPFFLSGCFFVVFLFSCFSVFSFSRPFSISAYGELVRKLVTTSSHFVAVRGIWAAVEGCGSVTSVVWFGVVSGCRCWRLIAFFFSHICVL